MRTLFKHTLAIAGIALAAQAVAQVTFYENEDFGGRSFTTDRPVDNFARRGFNDRASSVVVERGDRWEVCQDAGFAGRCVMLRPGRYASLASMGLNDRVSSVRTVDRNTRIDDDRYAPPPRPDFRRRHNERLYEANVTSVRAVLGPPEQRCWIESQQAPNEQRNAGGAIAGALIGGILGHQIGNGNGRTLATVGGVVAGAAVGNQIARNSQGEPVEVQRCANVQSSAPPSFWDVSYQFRGQNHQVQLAAPPGPTITVNRDGEPRGG